MRRHFKIINPDLIIIIILIALVVLTFKYWSSNEANENHEAINQSTEQLDNKVSSANSNNNETDILPKKNTRDSPLRAENTTRDETERSAVQSAAGKDRVGETRNDLVESRNIAFNIDQNEKNDRARSQSEISTKPDRFGEQNIDKKITKPASEMIKEEPPPPSTNNSTAKNASQPVKNIREKTTRTLISGRKGTGFTVKDDNTIVISISAKDRLSATEDSY